MGCGVCPGDFLNKTPYKFEYEGMGSGDEAGMTGQGHSKMKDTELDLLKNAEFKEAFDEFDKVSRFTIHRLCWGCFSGGGGAKAGVSTLWHLSGVSGAK